MKLRIRRLVERDGRTVIVELGRYWEIAISSELAGSVVGRQWFRWGKQERQGFTRRLREGAILPLWYGYAYRDFDREVGVYMPVPFNLLAAAWRWFLSGPWHSVRFVWPRKFSR